MPSLPITYAVAFARLHIAHYTAGCIYSAVYGASSCQSRLLGCWLPISSTVAFETLIRDRRASIVRTSQGGRVSRSAPDDDG
jgi:hypothetical protein